MRNLLPVALAATIVAMPACCIFSGHASSPRQRQADVATASIDKTVALVHWVAAVDKDEDGDPVYAEVDPEKHSNAKLLPYCAGVWVSSDVILTAEHCVADIGAPEIDPMEKLMEMLSGVEPPDWDPSGQPVMYSVKSGISDDDTMASKRSINEAFVLAVDIKHDLALVKARPEPGTSMPDHSVATLAPDVSVGEHVTIVGHPAGYWWTVTLGDVGQWRPSFPNAHEHPTDTFQITAPVWKGNSGGGAFDDDGNLVGIASWINMGAPDMSFFIDRRVAIPMLQHNRVIPERR